MSEGLAIGSGLARGLSNVLLSQRQRDQEDQVRKEAQVQQVKMSILSRELENGGDPNVLIPALGIDLHFGEKPKKGQPNHNDILQQLLQPHAQQVQGLQPAIPAAANPEPQVGPPEDVLPSRALVSPATPPKPTVPGQIPFTSPEEVAQRKIATETALDTAKLNAQAEAKLSLAKRLRAADPTMSLQDSLVAVGLKVPEDQFAVVPSGGGIFNKKTGDITEAPSAKAGKSGTTGMTGDMKTFIDTALASGGIDPRKATDDQILSVLPTAAKLAQDKISDQDALRETLLGMRRLQESVITQRQGNLPTETDLQQNARTITLNGTPYRYINKGDYAGADAQNAATKAGKTAGVVVVSPQEADQLKAAEGAFTNVDAFFDSIKSKLPEDYQNRPWSAISNKLKQFFQSDDELASAGGWDITVLPALAALRVSGRVPVQEFNRALAAKPLITDTLSAAEKKRDTLKTIISNAVKPILDKGGPSAALVSVSFTDPKTGKTVTASGTQAQVDQFKRRHPDAK